MKFRLFLSLPVLFFISFFSPGIQAQVLDGKDCVPGRYLIQFNSRKNVDRFCANIAAARKPIRAESCGPSSSIITVEATDLSWEDCLELVANTDGVVAVQKDYYLEERSKTPNDALFVSNQWDMRKIQAPEAWDYTTGGKTPLGHDIVVGILDAGFYVDHPDLSANLFVNHAEIPGNGIDDDNNGYIDDVNGVNLETNNGTHQTATHGTGVMGIIGAQGNNGIGLAGVNWNVKIIPVSRAVASVASLIRGYEYLRDFRKKFNATGGEEGALVVATNLSAGLSKKWPADQPIWCNMYDSLGQEGILSTGATVNANTNVDVEGDLPSTCESEFLIVVTNTNQNDIKHQLAGFGSTSVDLGAPGEGSTSTASPEGYDPFGGTSCATPHVTGAIALMYAQPGSGLEHTYMNYPVQSARSVRNAILNNVDKISSLSGITVTGGRLNLFRMLTGFVASAPGYYPQQMTVFPNPAGNYINIDLNDSVSRYYLIEVADIHGVSMLRQKYMTNERRISIDLPQLNSGTYLLKITGENINGFARFVKI